MRSIALWALTLTGALSTHAHAANYVIDAAHTFVTFEIDHNSTSTNRVRFDQIEGTIAFERAAQTGQADIRVATSSVNSGTQAFDEHLKSASIFNTQAYPQARFVSERFVFNGQRVAAIHGQLTLMGKTHPVVLQAKKFNCYFNLMQQGRETCGGDFEAEIDRSLWGLTYARELGIPNAVKIVIQIEAVKAP